MIDAIRIMISGQADSAVVLSPLKNLFVAGDGVGVCGTIVGAGPAGITAARGVLEGTTVCSIPARKNKDRKV